MRLGNSEQVQLHSTFTIFEPMIIKNRDEVNNKNGEITGGERRAGIKYVGVVFLSILLSIIACTSLYSQEIKLSKPKLDGTIKAKYEYATEPGMSRFSVRNSRLGLTGSVSERVSYKGQVELSNEGKFAVLDLYATLRLTKELSFSLGQMSLPFFNTYTVTPANLMFANRPFIGKYFAGTRDIGAVAAYKTGWSNFPVIAEFGLFNGSTINNPVWTNKPSYVTRVQFGGMDGFRFTAKYYRLPLSDSEDYSFWGVDARYAGDNYKIETEIMNRYNDFGGVNRISSYIQGSYSFPLDNSRLVKCIIPALRWDSIGENWGNGMFDNNRLSLGVSFGLTEKPFKSLFRIDYEHYMVDEAIPEFLTGREIASDKLTFEILIVF